MDQTTETKKTILIVEDELNLMQAVSLGLTKEGYNVLEASNGEEGLKAALENHPDLIVTDIKMPLMDGLEMMEKLREDEWGKTVPTIILTNMDTENNVIAGLKSSVYDFLVKSNTTLEQLFNQIKTKLP